MEAFFAKYQAKLESNSFILPNHMDCRVWGGARYASGYGQIRVAWPLGTFITRKHEKVHRLAWMCFHKQIAPHYDAFDQVLHVSHLCHNRLCIHPTHLVLETKHINEERKHCKLQRLCVGTHNPLCIF
ncbi:hypothetical protein KUTeg_010777 [Tegillarca granosa]|uniref:Zinc-binding loop region of homing endonuclease domain-containing protein n=1 Tax=Tegillarca granosa TaxID=220873 RepID=A0ABQ9F207_TEGGR|nr:hypothetical protein KUTeg_010777 [Tegillarca granosa]